ncbi:MAG: hypothetical protein DHS20C05_02790 [Hyphococcus sp.]|nr:MAG: hypothetical protein DHS20C05_02790 [Marinicaulis sp.]
MNLEQLNFAASAPETPFIWGVGFIVAGIVGALAIKLIWGMAQWGRKSPFRVGELMADTRVEVTEWKDNQGYVRAGGELWRAKAKHTLREGDDVVVTRVDGLMLEVKPK